MTVYENKEVAPRATWGPQLRTAVLATIVLTILTGIFYPLLITGIAQVLFPGRAHGSLIQRDGKVIGSELVGQNFSIDQFLLNNTVPPTQTQALAQYPYFYSRPSAAGAGYDGTSSGASNLGPTNKNLIDTVKGRIAAIKQAAGAGAAEVPIDLVTASASGLDPEISPAAAAYQVSRIARLRGLAVEQVQQLVNQNTRGRTLGFLGEPGVNVLKLNLALDGAKH